MSLPDNVLRSHRCHFNTGQMSELQYQLFQMRISLEGSSGKMRGRATVQIKELFSHKIGVLLSHAPLIQAILGKLVGLLAWD